MGNVSNQGSTAFFLLSVLVRVVTAVGESALPTAAMALASRQVGFILSLFLLDFSLTMCQRLR